MGVPSKCTIVRAMGRSAYKLEAKTHKRNHCILCLKKISVQRPVYCP